MQRLDGISLYQNHLSQVTQSPQGAAAEAVSTVRRELLQLTAGSVFEGVITHMNGDTAMLSLDNGQNIQAKLELGVQVQLGQPVLFQVQSNDESQIVLKQVPVNSGYNPTLQKALTTAGLPITERNVDMVNIMMQRQMPIDKESLGAMARVLQRYPEASPETLVEMKKLGFSMNEGSVAQFESYRAGEHALVSRFTELMEQLPEEPALQKELLAVLELEQAAGKGAAGELEQAAARGTKETAGELEQAAARGTQEIAGELEQAAAKGAQETAGELEQAAAKGAAGELEQAAAKGTAGNAENPGVLGENGSISASQSGLSQLLSPGETENLQQQLRQIPGLAEDAALFTEEGILKEDLTTTDVLLAVQKHLEQEGGSSKAMQELFQGKEYKTLVKEAMREQWLLEPQQAESKENVEKLYQRLERQMEKLGELLQHTGKDALAANRNVTQVRGNLEMMNQINQLYNYIQIPLKLQNQNAHSDLYVYTNKKRLQDKEGELTALLHLELEHLGTTDVQIKMLQDKVTTNFFMSDDVSFQLVEAHVEQLQQRLEEKGYHCSIHLENTEKKMDFVEDFLEQEAPVGKLQRYSFDVLT